MSDNKLLTLCIPTYNRGVHLKEQLTRLSAMPAELWKDITVFVSDNCSTDNTKEIAQQYTSNPSVDIIYSRNDSNLGMDGNFVKCFTSAKSSYVWLLGDDDYILIDKLPLIIKLLKETNCGVCHLGIDRKDPNEFTLFKNDTESFLKEIGIYISFISSNIVKTKYVPEIDFLKYYGSFFTLIPLYLNAMIKESLNVMVNSQIMESPKDAGRNGGYGICTVFIDNYLGIFREYVDKGMLSEQLYAFEKETVFNFVRSFVVKYYIFKEKSLFKPENTWEILYRHYGKTKVRYSMLKSIVGYCRDKILSIK
jgi:glycosyltransferase involved in cell wall biosynthesis